MSCRCLACCQARGDLTGPKGNGLGPVSENPTSPWPQDDWILVFRVVIMNIWDRKAMLRFDDRIHKMRRGPSFFEKEKARPAVRPQPQRPPKFHMTDKGTASFRANQPPERKRMLRY